VAKFVHELFPERWAALFEQLGANAQCGTRGPVAKSPAAEVREHGYELNRGFGQAVARPLAGSRVLTSEQSRLDESLESVGENIGGDTLDRVGLQLSEVAAVSEDDVAEDEQAPAIAEHLDGGVDWTLRPRLIRFAHSDCNIPPPRYDRLDERLQITCGTGLRAEAGRFGEAGPVTPRAAAQPPSELGGRTRVRKPASTSLNSEETGRPAAPPLICKAPPGRPHPG
jgi:hypothetical protein